MFIEPINVLKVSGSAFDYAAGLPLTFKMKQLKGVSFTLKRLQTHSNHFYDSIYQVWYYNIAQKNVVLNIKSLNTFKSERWKLG